MALDQGTTSSHCIIFDRNGNIVAITHDLKMNSIRLRGGKDNIAIKIITSRFKGAWQ